MKIAIKTSDHKENITHPCSKASGWGGQPKLPRPRGLCCLHQGTTTLWGLEGERSGFTDQWSISHDIGTMERKCIPMRCLRGGEVNTSITRVSTGVAVTVFASNLRPPVRISGRALHVGKLVVTC